MPPVALVASELPEFSLGERQLSPGEQAYLDYYLLDFSSEFPVSNYSLGCVQSGDHRLAVQAWLQPDSAGTLMLVHGYFDHVGLFHHLIRYGLQRGYNVLAFDLPGHGLSSGERACIDDFADYRRSIAAVRAAASLAGPWYLLGQSTGGAAIMDYLNSGQGKDIERTVLLAPLIRPRNWRTVSLAHTVLKRFRSSIRRTFAENSNDAQFLAFLQIEPLQPRRISTRWLTALKSWLKDFTRRAPCSCSLLVIQGDDDGTVDWEYNLPELKRLFNKAQVYMLTGGRHHLANEASDLRSEYMQQISQFLERN